MFDKLKKRMHLNAEEESSLKALEEMSFEPTHTNYLLVNLAIQAADYPDDLEIITPFLDSIHEKIQSRENTPIPVSEDSEPFGLDASVELIFSSDLMTAFLYVLPPIGDGRDICEETLLEALIAQNVIFGIDTELVSQIAHTKAYNTIYAIARGTVPIKGIDGEIIDHFSRVREIHPDEDEKGIVDYKILGLFQMIQAQEVICDIIYPLPGQDGQNVKGTVLTAIEGKMPVIPKGKNTSLNEEGSALISDLDGDLSFVGNAFCVAPMLMIPGNVDHSTGNLDFSGDIFIKGDVCKSFQVHAGGNVTVCGMAEGASIRAEGNIEIQKGMNGSGDGTLTAGGSITAHFLEQTTVHAAFDVNAETIVNCNIVSGGSIFATKGRGSIIAGNLSATKSVIAKRIGNLSNIKTTIKIGYLVKDDENIDFLVKELKKFQETLDKLNQNILFLEKLPSIPEDKTTLYHTLLDQRKEYEFLVTETEEKFHALHNQELNYQECFVQGDVIYAITSISLAKSSVIINDSTSKCKIYYQDGELEIGTF